MRAFAFASLVQEGSGGDSAFKKDFRQLETGLLKEKL